MEIDFATKEDINELKDLISSLSLLVKKLAKESKCPDVVTISDICSIKGLSRTQLVLREQYLMPNYGVSDYPDGVKRWNLSTYEDWEKIPVSERKKAYEQMKKRMK